MIDSSLNYTLVDLIVSIIIMAIPLACNKDTLQYKCSAIIAHPPVIPSQSWPLA